MRLLPVVNGDGHFLHGGTKLRDGVAIFQSERLAQAFFFRATSVGGALAEAPRPGCVHALSFDHVLNGGAEAFHQAYHQDDQHHADHDAKHGEKTAQFVHANGVYGQFEILAEVAMQFHG